MSATVTVPKSRVTVGLAGESRALSVRSYRAQKNGSGPVDAVVTDWLPTGTRGNPARARTSTQVIAEPVSRTARRKPGPGPAGPLAVRSRLRSRRVQAANPRPGRPARRA